jgi:DNA polymerase III delta prime subunit
MHHAFVIEAEAEQGIGEAFAWAKRELGMKVEQNPDIAVLRYGLFSVADARKVAEVVAGAPFAGDHKVVIVAASRAYHEAQNALLKVFEEPAPGTHLFLVLPILGGLLPTLRSRVQVLDGEMKKAVIPEVVETFLRANKEKRSALIKKLSTGSDEEERREHREEAIALMNGIEAAAYAAGKQRGEAALLLSDIATLRGYLYDRSAPVKMILEHLSLVVPKDLV